MMKSTKSLFQRFKEKQLKKDRGSSTVWVDRVFALEERAAIIEFDGQEPRHSAENKAIIQFHDLYLGGFG